jgi:hypothetical protein
MSFLSTCGERELLKGGVFAILGDLTKVDVQGFDMLILKEEVVDIL